MNLTGVERRGEPGVGLSLRTRSMKRKTVNSKNLLQLYCDGDRATDWKLGGQRDPKKGGGYWCVSVCPPVFRRNRSMSMEIIEKIGCDGERGYC